MQDKKIVTTEMIPNLTKSDFESLEQWQIASLSENDIKRLIQRKHELGLPLHGDEKMLIGTPLDGADVSREIGSTIVSFIDIFILLVIFFLIYNWVFD